MASSNGDRFTQALTQPLFSIIITGLSLPQKLGALLESVDRSRAVLGNGAAEIIVVGSYANATETAIQNACELVGAQLLDCPRPSWRQRNHGARQGRGKWLLFLHGDCLASPSLLSAYREALQTRSAISFAVGYTEFHWGTSPPISCLDAATDLGRHVPFATLTAFPADSGNVLIRREAFAAVHGFRDVVPAGNGAIEIDICIRLQEWGGALSPVPQATCGRFFDSLGEVRCQMRNAFRSGWDSVILMRHHPAHKQLAAPDCMFHALCLLGIASTCLLVTHSWQYLWLPFGFALLIPVLYTAAVLLRTHRWRMALALVATWLLTQLPYRAGGIVGALVRLSPTQLMYRMDMHNHIMDMNFSWTVLSLWCDHLAILLSLGLVVVMS